MCGLVEQETVDQGEHRSRRKRLVVVVASFITVLESDVKGGAKLDVVPCAIRTTSDGGLIDGLC